MIELWDCFSLFNLFPNATDTLLFWHTDDQMNLNHSLISQEKKTDKTHNMNSKLKVYIWMAKKSSGVLGLAACRTLASIRSPRQLSRLHIPVKKTTAEDRKMFFLVYLIVNCKIYPTKLFPTIKLN